MNSHLNSLEVGKLYVITRRGEGEGHVSNRQGKHLLAEQKGNHHYVNIPSGELVLFLGDVTNDPGNCPHKVNCPCAHTYCLILWKQQRYYLEPSLVPAGKLVLATAKDMRLIKSMIASGDWKQ